MPTERELPSALGGVSTQIGAEFHKEFALFKLIETYNGKYSRIIIEARDSHIVDLRCFTNDPQQYNSCSGKCGCGSNIACENWQIKTKPGGKPWTESNIESFLKEIESDCDEASPKLALQGEYSQPALDRFGNDLRIYRIQNFSHINEKIDKSLLDAPIKKECFPEVRLMFSDFYNKRLKQYKTIDITHKALIDVLSFDFNVWRGQVPLHQKNQENILIPNRGDYILNLIDMDERNGCSLNEIISGDVNELKTKKIACLSSSLICIYGECDEDTLDFIEDICSDPKTNVKLVISPTTIDLKLRSRHVDQSIRRPGDSGQVQLEEAILDDFDNYRMIWRPLHAEGLKWH